MAETDDKVTYQHAAETFGVHLETIRDWAARGLIKKYRRPLDRKVYVSLEEIRRLREAEPRAES